MLEKRLYLLQEVRSIIYFRQFIHPLSLRSRGNGTSFVFTSYILKSAKFCNVSFLNNFILFHSFNICSSACATIVHQLFICRHYQLFTYCSSAKLSAKAIYITFSFKVSFWSIEHLSFIFVFTFELK